MRGPIIAEPPDQGGKPEDRARAEKRLENVRTAKADLEQRPLGFGTAGLVLAVVAMASVALGIACMATASPMQGGVVGSGMLWAGLVELLAGLGVLIGSRALARAFVAVRRA